MYLSPFLSLANVKFTRTIDLNAKFEHLSTHVKGLDNQIAQVASTSQGPKGALPGKSEANLKEYCAAITLRSGKELPSRDRSRILSMNSIELVKSFFL